jgi:hypothetical protein
MNNRPFFDPSILKRAESEESRQVEGHGIALHQGPRFCLANISSFSQYDILGSSCLLEISYWMHYA